jgi:hypothetical protein
MSSGGNTPNISLPNVRIGNNNTAIGSAALWQTMGGFNTALGATTLFSNTSGDSNTAAGVGTLFANTTGSSNTGYGLNALVSNSTGGWNTAVGLQALHANTTGSSNTAIGSNANVAAGDLTNATAIGAEAVVDASNKIRLGNTAVTVIEAQVGLTVVSDRTQKENLQPVDREGVLRKLRSMSATSWNLVGQDPARFRHYGPMAQEFFAAFGHDGVGTIGTPTTITSTDMAGVLMIAVQALEARTEALQSENAELRARLDALEERR